MNAHDSRWLGRISYEDGLALQETAADTVRTGGVEALILLEHDPVYTIGRTRDQSSIPDLEKLPAPIHVIGRGGQATWHGPGQLVGYPIIDLNRRVRDLHRYLRAIEDALIHALEKCGIEAGISEGRTGVWVEDRKIASIGIGARGWITTHGFALNVASDLSGFDAIVPCGLDGVRMTSVAHECANPPNLPEMAELVKASFWQTLDRALPLTD